MKRNETKRSGARKRPAALQMAGAKVSEHRLANGMRLIVAERRGDPVVASVLFFPVGSRNETEREAGVAHFLEHMMFKGTKRHGKGEVDRITTQLGGSNNAFTGHDHTAYWFEFASDRWEKALELEADRMGGLLLDPAEFDSEREVVLEELAMGEDDPWRVLARNAERALFPNHPYGRPIIGFVDSLRAMTPETMRAFYERFYHVGNATLVLAGDVSASKALREVRKRFGKKRAGPSLAEVDAFRPRLGEPAGEVRITTHWDDEGRRLLMGWPTVSVATGEDYALDIALVALTSGRLSRLQRRLVFETGLATTVSASNDTRVEGGAFWIYAECSQGAERTELERVIDEEIDRMSREKLRAAEMRRAMAILRSSEAFDAETVSDLAEELGEWAVDADWRWAFDGCERHARQSAADVRDTVARLLRPERRVLAWCVPKGERVATEGPKPARRAARKAARKKAAAKGAKRR